MTDLKFEGRFPDWKKIYDQMPVDQMPWFSPVLDNDLAREIDERGLRSGRFLDLGTGPGTQAVELAKRGFEVTATDISPGAIARARDLGAPVRFQVDDVLASELVGPFDFVFDRGCFHVFAPEQREKYLQTVSRIIHPGGILFLKTFSTAMPEAEVGPYRYDEGAIKRVFDHSFNLEYARAGVYEGTRDPQPLALFSVFTRRDTI